MGKNKTVKLWKEMLFRQKEMTVVLTWRMQHTHIYIWNETTLKTILALIIGK